MKLAKFDKFNSFFLFIGKIHQEKTYFFFHFYILCLFFIFRIQLNVYKFCLFLLFVSETWHFECSRSWESYIVFFFHSYNRILFLRNAEGKNDSKNSTTASSLNFWPSPWLIKRDDETFVFLFFFCFFLAKINWCQNFFIILSLIRFSTLISP